MNKIKHIQSIISLWFLFGGMFTYAQKDIVLKGQVVDDASGQLIPYATVALYLDDTLTDGVSTTEDGTFELTTQKEYTHMVVSFIGYETHRMDISQIPNGDAILIRLKPDINMLEEVVVEGERTSVEFKIDRKVINLGADLQQAGTTALEAFDQIAEIQTNPGTGIVSLRGNNNVRILVNGKPSPLRASELLSQIPSNSIKSVEIITSPSAKYQANGLSGIINIVLKKNKSLGVNLDIDGSVGTRRYGYGVSSNYNSGNINFNISASQNGRKMGSKQTVDRLFSDGNTQSIFTPVDFYGLVRTVNTEIDFYADDKNDISVRFNFTDDHHSFNNTSHYFNMPHQDDYNYLRDSKHFHYTNIYNLNYRRKFADESHFLEFDFNINTNRNQYPAEDYINGEFLHGQYMNDNNTIHTLSLDYRWPISKQWLLETGASLNTGKTKSSQKINEPDADFNHFFDYNESLLGTYVQLKVKKDKLEAQMGLRHEYFDAKSKLSLGNTTAHRNFSNLFPAVHVSYTPWEGQHIFKLGYSKRISRPNLHHINPFQLGNPHFRFEGNASLKPELSDVLEFNYQKIGSGFNTSLTLFYRHIKDVIVRFNDIEDERVQVVTFQNKGTNHTYGVETHFKYDIAPFWDASLNANIYVTKVLHNELVTWDDLFSSSVQLRNNFRITKNITTDLSYRFSPKRQYTFEQIEPRHRLDWAIRAKMMDNRLTTSLRIIDVFDNNLLKRKTVTQDFTQYTVWRLQSQTFGILLSAQYKILKGSVRQRERKKRTYRLNESTG
ncbi:MAG: TonB-dependent receptor [Flavobacteriaceae bacterium]